MSKKTDIQELNQQILDMWAEIRLMELYLHNKQLLDDYMDWKRSLKKKAKNDSI